MRRAGCANAPDTRWLILTNSIFWCSVPPWWGIGCHYINYIDASSSRCSAVRPRLHWSCGDKSFPT